MNRVQNRWPTNIGNKWDLRFAVSSQHCHGDGCEDLGFPTNKCCKQKAQLLGSFGPVVPVYVRAGGSLTTTECGHLRPQTPVKDSGSLMTTKCGHLRPQNLIFTDRANKTSTVHGVTCDHRMRSLTTTKHFHNRTTEGGGVGGMITYLGLHTDTLKGGLVYRLWACTHAGPFWWVGVGWVGW